MLVSLGEHMAWKWPGSSKSGGGEEWTGFIDQGVTMEGTLTVTGTFRIDGNVKGNVISEQTLILGENAKVEGQIEGNRVVIAGRYDGVIFAKGRVEIQPKGVVTGEVHSPCLVIDPGGIFDGRCHMLVRLQFSHFWLPDSAQECIAVSEGNRGSVAICAQGLTLCGTTTIVAFTVLFAGQGIVRESSNHRRRRQRTRTCMEAT